jgi:hypothetical protein
MEDKGCKCENSLIIAQDGEPRAVVVVPAEMDENIQDAVSALVEYVQKSTGAVLQIKTSEELTAEEDLYSDMVRIYVGFTGPGCDPHIQADLEGMDNDGFIIRPHGNSITIMGPTSWGTRFGVNDFLERYVGVRWLMPGEDGEDVPQHEIIAVPRKDDIKEEPAFAMRLLSPFAALDSSNTLGFEWATQNRTHSMISFHHNLYSLFPPDEFGQSNPEFYPMRNGVRYIPSKGVTTGWQPCFAVPETVTVAANKIIQYFDKNPEQTSFSLGVNDGGGFCDGTHSEYSHSTDKINSVGLPDMSDLYYKWVNDVVKEVRKVYPDKWFGVLAYDYVADPPSFKLDSHVVPFITKDRMTWIDPEVEAVGKNQNEKWKEVSDNIGWYDYMYGLCYALPRMYTQQTAENLIYAKENNVSAHYVELYPNWGEGPKPWVLTKLLWNPYQNVEKLENEWYVRAVGPEAAPYLKQYYDHWEAFWTERVKESLWFETDKDKTYLSFNSAEYLDLVTNEEIAESRKLLETVVEKTQTDKQKSRANMLYRMFEYYEASALSYPKNYGPITDSETALSLLKDGALDEQVSMAVRRNQIIDELLKDPVLKFNDPRNYALNWDGLNPTQFWRLADYMKQYEENGGPVTERANELVQKPEESLLKEYASLLIKANAGTEYVNLNPSFEDTNLLWVPWISTTGSIKRVEGFARTGNASIKIENLRRGGPFQIIPTKSGLTAVRAYFYTPADKTTKATIQLSINLMDANKTSLSTIKGNAVPIADTAGEWAPIGMLADIPDLAKNKEVKYIQLVVVVDGLVDGVELYLDDAYAYQCN